MPKPFSPLVESLVDLLSPLGELRVKRMFGGYGLYLNELFFAIVSDNILYLKVDDVTRPVFEERGLKPFVVGRGIALSYHEVPEEALDSPMKIKPWVVLALQAAQRAATAPKPRRKRG